MKPNGVILWRGASLIDGAPIVAIAVGLRAASSNRKTGAMVQTYILRSDVDPIRAVKRGADVSICGKCPHRGKPAPSKVSAAVSKIIGKVTTADGPHSGRTCYVNIGQGPLAVYRAFKRGRYPEAGKLGNTWGAPMDIENCGAARAVRLGTYGDPAAVPADIWRALTRHAIGHTGYTHQWRTAPGLRSLCMASVDSEDEAREAWRAGWRSFRVGMPGHPAMLREETGPHAARIESLCPASKEAGKLLTCDRCLACSGAHNGRRGSIFIPAHGGTAVMANVRRLSAIPVVVQS